jgi:hypothetical protein
MLFAEIRDDKGTILGMIQLDPKDFKTGSKGYWGQGKLAGAKEGERLQVQVQAVVIGSKEAAAAEKPKG